MTDAKRTVLTPGIHLDFDVDAYHADPCPEPSLTQSIAKLLIDRSPAHAKAAHPRLTPPDPADDETPEPYKAAQAIGSAAHAYLIGRGKTVAVFDGTDWRSKEARAFRDEKSAAGSIPILSKHMVQVTRLVDAVRDQCEQAGWLDAFDNGDGEVVVVWQEGGIWARTMIDWLGNRVPTVYDLKTTTLSVAPHAIPNLMTNAGWDVQAAMQERGLDIVDPGNAGRRTFRFVAVENAPPFALTPVELPESVMTMGRKKLAYALDLWRRCMESGEWPAYSAEVCRPSYPAWQEARWLDREVEEAERRPRQLHSIMGG
jgi:hypothetical protein